MSWSPPADTFGMAVDSWVVITSPAHAKAKTFTAMEVATDLTHEGRDGRVSATVDGLRNGTEYTFTVSAINVVGRGPASAETAPVVPVMALARRAAEASQLLEEGSAAMALESCDAGLADWTTALRDNLAGRSRTYRAALADVLWIRGAALHALDAPADALSAVQSATELVPTHGRAHLLRAQLLEDRGDRVAALKAFEAAGGADASLVDAHLGASRCAAAQEDFSRALAAADRAVAADSSSLPAYVARGRARLELDDAKGAVEDLEVAWEGGEESEETLTTYGDALAALALQLDEAGEVRIRLPQPDGPFAACFSLLFLFCTFSSLSRLTRPCYVTVTLLKLPQPRVGISTALLALFG